MRDIPRKPSLRFLAWRALEEFMQRANGRNYWPR
jgi:hypothetical protein